MVVWETYSLASVILSDGGKPGRQSTCSPLLMGPAQGHSVSRPLSGPFSFAISPLGKESNLINESPEKQQGLAMHLKHDLQRMGNVQPSQP